MKKTLLLILSLILGILTAYVQSVTAATILVPSDYPTIQAAINAAHNGDLIMVAPGTYYENIDFSGKAITVKGLRAEGEGSPIIDGTKGKPIVAGYRGSSVVSFQQGEGNDSILSGFTVTNAKDSGIYCSNGSSPTITHCSILHNYASRGGGIYCRKSSPIIINCLIHHNLANNGGGIHCENNSQPVIKNCTICDNNAFQVGGGVYRYDGTALPVITNTIIWGNDPDGIAKPSYSTLTITYSLIQQETGVYPGIGNINIDPLFAGMEIENYYLQPYSPCINAGTLSGAPPDDMEGIPLPQGSGIDMGAYEYVEASSCIPRASFAVDQTTGIDPLTVTFDASSSGGSQYTGATFLWDFGDGETGSGLTVSHTYGEYGAFQVSLVVTTECGSHKVTFNELIKVRSPRITKEVGEGCAYSTIQKAIDDAQQFGEIILVHNGIYYENINFKGKGITIYSENGAQHTIIDGGAKGTVVTFENQKGQYTVFDGFTLTNGTNSSNGSGIVCQKASSPIIKNCLIKKNKSGSAIYCTEDSSPVIEKCIIRENIDTSKAGISCGYKSSPQILHCEISQNIFQTGIYCIKSSPSITNTIISNNKARGIYCDASSPILTNCTICNNLSKEQAGGIYCVSDPYDESHSSPVISNCIVWGNTPDQIYRSNSSSSPKVTFSDIQQATGVYSGEKNINADPAFVGGSYGNYFLRKGSPCIDTGTSSGAPLTDKENITRPQGVGIDMGAYEYVEASSCIPRASFTVDQTTGTNPLTVSFDASSSGGSQYEGAIFSWEFGDGKTGSGLTTSHTYSLYGIYSVTLSISTACGSHSLTLPNLIYIKSSQITKEVGQGCPYPTIQGAINNALDGEIILVHDGTYNEALDFQGKKIELRSQHGAEKTIIDYKGKVVKFNYFEGPESILDGFTLKQGRIECGYLSSPIVKNCIIVNNDGYGLYCDRASPTVKNCIFRDSYGLYCTYSSPTIINCLIVKNKRSGICCKNSSPKIVNCTISDNSADNKGGGIYGSSSSPIITNCILWGNRPDEIFVSEGSPQVSFSDISYGSDIYPGEGNLNKDPLFIAGKLGNYYLHQLSPCIDKGTLSEAPQDDLERRARPQGSGIDLGAYEYVETSSCVPHASFTADKSEGISPLKITFDASSSVGSSYDGAKFVWDFGDGEEGGGVITSHIYNKHGIYDVKLTVTTECGSDELFLTDIIKVSSSEPTRQVGKGYPYSSIQAAINAAGDGEVILVHDGLYYENINFQGKRILVISENGPEKTIIDGKSTGKTVVFDHGEGQGTLLEGFTIQHGSDRGIYLANYSSPSISQCRIVDNNGGGIDCSSSSSPILINCLIAGNYTTGEGGGIRCSKSSPQVINCTISQNLSGGGGGGIYCGENSAPIVTNSIIWGNVPDEIKNRTLLSRFSDIRQANSVYPGEGNINKDPLFVLDKGGNFYLQPKSPCLNTGTLLEAPSEDQEGIVRPQGMGIDMGAYEYLGPTVCIPRASFIADQITGTNPLTVTFDASSSGGSSSEGAVFLWDFGDGETGTGLTVTHTYTDFGPYNVSLVMTTACGSDGLILPALIRVISSQTTKEVGGGYAYSSIQKAVDEAKHGEVILVHDGTYYENINFKGKAITLISANGQGKTIIDGGAKGEVVSFITREGQDSVLEGFTIQNGSNNGGIYCSGFSSPCLRNCLIKGNSGSGGIHCIYVSSPHITNCLISQNLHSGIDCNDSSSPIILNCTISGNVTRYGGIYCRVFSSPVITQCTISGNVAEENGGGIYCSSSSPVLTNCIFYKNSSKNGSAIYCLQNSSPVITNCTFSRNVAESGDGVVYCNKSSPLFTNCILWGNAPANIYLSESTPTFIYSDIEQKSGVYPGEGNLNADPLFVWGKEGNLFLQPDSPCIDHGESSKAPLDDRDGIARPQGAGIDMGAYEYIAPSSCFSRASFIANKTTGIDPLTISFDASSSVGRQLPGAAFFWDFGDGASGSGLTATHTYTQYGIYGVSLVLTTECGSHTLTLPELIHVTSSQVTKEVGEGYPYSSIQQAIDEAGEGEVILVHDGTYYENINFKGKGIRVVSEHGAEKSLIDGKGSGPTVTFGHFEGLNSVLDGFTIKNGNGKGNSRFTVEKTGGGIDCADFSSPTIANCIISENVASYGGGISCRNSSSPTITDCTFSGNDSAGGCIYSLDSSPIIIRCTIKENIGSGINCLDSPHVAISYSTISKNSTNGIECSASSLDLTNCSIKENKGIGISCLTCSLSIANSSIDQNSRSGIKLDSNTSGEIFDCIISENGRSGISCAQSSLILKKCIITKNSTGVSRQKSSIHTEDCIFSNNVYGPCVILKSYTINDGLPSNHITAIHVDDQEAWIGTFDGGVAQYNFVEDKWVTTNEENGLASARVYDIVKYKECIYVGTGSGISIWDGHAWETKTSLGRSKLCNVIFEVHDDLLWVASRTMHGGFFSYDGENWKDHTTMKPGRPLNNISDFTYQEDILWIGSTNSGMYRFNGNDWLYYTVADGLASNFIYTITCKESVCYAGSCCGLSVFKEGNWQTYNVEDGLCHPTINAIAVDENFVWLGTRDGLSLYDDLRFTSFPSDIGPGDEDQVNSLFVRENEVWIGTSNGLYCLIKTDCDYIDPNMKIYYADNDMDGYGDPNHWLSAYNAPAGYVSNFDDCDDTSAVVHPGAKESCDGYDNNCDGQVDEGLLSTFYLDADGDGYGYGDGDPSIWVRECNNPPGYVGNKIDCYDADPNINPGKIEIIAVDGSSLENFEYGLNLIKTLMPSCHPYTSYDLLLDYRELGSILELQYKDPKDESFDSTYWFFGKASGQEIELSKDPNTIGDDLYIIERSQ